MLKYNNTGKVAVITGAASGIGLVIARRLVDSGVKVVINDTNEQLANESIKRIDPEGANSSLIIGDAGEKPCIDAIVDKAISTYGQLDFAVANAGITTFGDFLSYSPDDFKQLVSLNLQGSFFLAQGAAKAMIQSKSGGRILMMSSTTGHRAHPNLAAYGMTKAALEMLTRSLAVELGGYGINVNAIAPGAVMTERTKNEDPHYQVEWERVIPNGRVGFPEDIAGTAMFLLSEDARHITGQSILVDGGWTGYSPNPDYLSQKK